MSNTLFSMNDGDNAETDLRELFIGTAGYAVAWVVRQGVEEASLQHNAAIVDNIVHNIRIHCKTDDLYMTQDRVHSTADSDCTMPANMAVLDVGRDYDGGNHLFGLIGNIRIYRKTDEVD